MHRPSRNEDKLGIFYYEERALSKEYLLKNTHTNCIFILGQYERDVILGKNGLSDMNGVITLPSLS